jgi:ribosome-binding protein aMBF1 (putative translation factor)
MDDQDWTEVRIHRSKKTSAEGLRPGIARRNLMETPTKVSLTHAASIERKLMDSDAPVKLKKLSIDSRKLIAQKRAEMQISQQQLNNSCAFPPNLIRDIEAGKVTPSPAQLSNMNRILKTSIKLE